MARQRVAVIFGGRSGEHEVSLVSARSVMAALDRDRWEPVPFGVTRSGQWMTPGETQAALDAGNRSFDNGGAPLLGAADALNALSGCDAAFPLIHGTNGEDGTLQGFLELAGLPYAGAGVAASAIGMDKALMKALFREAGIPVARYAVVRAWEAAGDGQAARYVDETVGYPCFVKPANGGSSVGITKVRSREDLPAAFRAAFAYDDKAVIEASITGQEVECSVLGNEQPEAAQVLGEIVPDREFYDYASKYAADSQTQLLIPARIDEATAATVRELAVRMFSVMGCEGYARVDFFVEAGGRVVANEVNTIPGFTSISMYPKLWEASGLAYADLLTRILELALSRAERRAR
jgi:D-alanine-D-alanine ligase